MSSLNQAFCSIRFIRVDENSTEPIPNAQHYDRGIAVVSCDLDFITKVKMGHSTAGYEVPRTILTNPQFAYDVIILFHFDWSVVGSSCLDMGVKHVGPTHSSAEDT